MRSTTERIKLAKKQADEIKKQHNEKRHRLAVISCYSFGIALIVVISALVCNLNFTGFEQMPMRDTASIFANKVFFWLCCCRNFGVFTWHFGNFDV